jgi:hypothetical protein
MCVIFTISLRCTNCVVVLQHCITIHFGLEASLIRMKRSDYDELISVSRPGSNKNKTKAHKLRRFPLPKRFIEPASPKKDARHVTILVALVCADIVYALADFSRLARIHVTSRHRMWAADDFEVGSEVSLFSFSSPFAYQISRVGKTFFGASFLPVPTGHWSVLMPFNVLMNGETGLYETT